MTKRSRSERSQVTLVAMQRRLGPDAAGSSSHRTVAVFSLSTVAPTPHRVWSRARHHRHTNEP
jgi:hypothetical protein